jgi:pimeloyl-ACP methyl ester carboxylesterase
MDVPPTENPAFATTADAVKDVSAAVDFILKRRGIAKLNLVGWSWGTAIMAGYTTANNDKVNKLVLYATLWMLKAPPPFSGTGAYRKATRDDVRARGLRGIPPQRVEDISPVSWFDKWWEATLATDPVGAKQNPPFIRAPNGVLKDVVDYWGAGITSSASAISCAGNSRPSALAVLRLMISSKLVGCSTGNSAGFAPLRILPV